MARENPAEGAWRLLRGRAPGRWSTRVAQLVALCALAGLLVHWVSAHPQANLHWIVLLLPVHAAVAWTMSRKA